MEKITQIVFENAEGVRIALPVPEGHFEEVVAFGSDDHPTVIAEWSGPFANRKWYAKSNKEAANLISALMTAYGRTRVDIMPGIAAIFG
jgi:hypothetical protein